MFGIRKKELKILKKLDSPKKIQDFLNGLKMNFEEGGDTSLSPMSVLEKRLVIAWRARRWRHWLSG